MATGIQVLIEAIDRVTGPTRRIGNAVRRIAGSLGLERIQRQIGRVVTGMGNVAREASAMATKVVAAGSLAAAGLFAMIKRSSDAGDAAAKAAQRIGVSVVGYQQLSYAAGLAGSNAEELANALKELNKKVLEAAGGNEDLRSAFRRMGVEIRDVNGQLRPTEDIFADLADAFARVPDGARKSAAAMALMGDAGIRMIPLLNGGSEGLRQAADEAQRLGLVIDGATAGTMERFNDNLSRLFGSITGLQHAITAKLLPVIDPLVTRITDWIAANRELIATKVQAFVETLPRHIVAARDAVEALYQTLRPVISAIGAVVERVGTVNAIFAVLSAIVGAKLLVAIGGLVWSLGQLALVVGSVGAAAGTFITAIRAGTGVMGAFNAVLLANPIGLVIAAIAALAGAAYLIYRNWDALAPWFSALWASIRQIFQGFADFVIGLLTLDFGRALEGLKGVGNGLVDYFTTLWEPVKAAFNAVVAWIDSVFGASIAGAIDSVWQMIQPIIETITAAIDGVMSAASKAVEIGAKVVDGVSGAVDATVSGASRAVDWASSGIRSVFGGGDVSAAAPVSAPNMASPFANGAPGQRVDAGGRIEMIVTAEGRPRVTSVQSNDSRVAYDVEVDAGHFMAVP